ncbi:MAG TPA: diacylglycerol kinase family protein [Chondromyces sp.]|nr:diacylglycerol kinase family protein [Chondromyces sp.]
MRIIVNPAAAGGRVGRHWPQTAAALERLDLAAPTVFTETPGHATELAAAAASDGVARVVVAGGDGTVCEAAEGLFRAGGGELAILPLGTGNDAARTLGVPLDLASAAAAACNGHVREVDLIRVGDRLVLNAIGVGLTGDINDRAARIKWVRGIAVYLVTTLASLFSYRTPQVRMESEAGTYEGSMMILAVHGGPTTGGGFALTPAAVPDDGLLDACLVPEVGVPSRLTRLLAAMRGTLGSKPGTIELQSSWLELHFAEPLPAHLDGNSVRLEPPFVRFEIVPKALKVVVTPPGRPVV